MSYCAHCGGQVPDGAAFCPSCGKPPAAAVVTTSGKSSKAVIVLVGCVIALVGLAVVGIIAAIAIPNFLDALQKAKQKRTVADLRVLGQAVESYKAEHGYAPAATDVAGLESALGPPYASSLARVDGWKHALQYACWQESATASGCDHYRIASPGRDGRFEHPDLKEYEPAEFAPTDYDRDIVFGDGAFIEVPKAR
jgi:type II secretory pathway pseudopilin PulG